MMQPDPIHGQTAAGRPYLVYLPNNFDENQLYPLILAQHPGGSRNSSAAGFAELWGIDASDHPEQFIIVFTQASPRPGTNEHNWNAGFTAKGTATSDDIGYISNVLEGVLARFRINRDLIFAAGYSNGAMFTYRMAKELNHVFRAIAVVSGTAGGQNGLQGKPHFNIPQSPSRRISLFARHNINDNTVSFEPTLGLGVPSDLTGHDVYDWYVNGSREIGFWPSVYTWFDANDFDSEAPHFEASQGATQRMNWENLTTIVRLFVDSDDQVVGHDWVAETERLIMTFFRDVGRLDPI